MIKITIIAILGLFMALTGSFAAGMFLAPADKFFPEKCYEQTEFNKEQWRVYATTLHLDNTVTCHYQRELYSHAKQSKRIVRK